MNQIRPSRNTLTSLELALAKLLDGLPPVEPMAMPVEQAGGYVAAEMPVLGRPLPAQNLALLDGWALYSLDLAGASAYSPVPLSQPPQWVETGQALPQGCDCVLKPDLVEHHGPLAQALAEASPGQGARRTGEDIAATRPLVLAGRGLGAADLLALRAIGCERVMVRAPVLRLIDLTPAGGGLTAPFIAALAREAGARVTLQTVGRDSEAIASALAHADGDIVVLVGGTGAGRSDCVAQALAQAGTLIAHGIALQLPAAIGHEGGKFLARQEVGQPDARLAAGIQHGAGKTGLAQRRRQRQKRVLVGEQHRDESPMSGEPMAKFLDRSRPGRALTKAELDVSDAGRRQSKSALRQVLDVIVLARDRTGDGIDRQIRPNGRDGGERKGAKGACTRILGVDEIGSLRQGQPGLDPVHDADEQTGHDTQPSLLRPTMRPWVYAGNWASWLPGTASVSPARGTAALAVNEDAGETPAVPGVAFHRPASFNSRRTKSVACCQASWVSPRKLI
jgi:molybdopterin molybdotransferase